MIPERSQLGFLDRFFSLFTKMRPGEGYCLFLLFWLGFIFMYGQWILKPVRDAFILSEADAELAAYGNAVQALLLMLIIPLYGVLYRRVSKTRLVQSVTGFFLVTLLVFYSLYAAGYPIYFPFYIWVGLYGTMLIAQFWALAADHFNVKSGQRLFGVLAAGVSLGGLMGPVTAFTFIDKIGEGNLLLIVAATLSLTLFLINPAVNAIPDGSRGTRTKDDDTKRSSVLGGFATVLKDRYLTLIAFFVVFQNLIDSMGDYILRTWVRVHAEHLISTGESSLSLSKQIGSIMADFYGLQNLVVFLLALLVVSRVIRFIGIRGSILVLPCVMIIGYGVIAFVPIFSIIRLVKITEKGTNYSLNNTVRGALFLPTSQEATYEGKTTIDSFFWRFGDFAQAGIIFVGLNWFDLQLAHMALLSMGLAGIMLWLAVLIGRHYRTLALTNVTNVPPQLNRSIPDAKIGADGLLEHALSADTFIDADPGEVLVLTACQVDGAPLPAWLNFDPSRLVFRGSVPADFIEEVVIQVTATDVDGAYVSDTFIIRHIRQTGQAD